MPSGYSERPFPRIRQAIIDLLADSPAHPIHGFGSVDVTDALERLEALAPSFGSTPSLTAYVAWCYAHAVEDHKGLSAIRRGRRLIVFDDIDVGTVVERKLPDGRFLPTRAYLRRANHKTFRELHDELRTIQDKPVRDPVAQKKFERFLALPRPIRRILLRWRHRDPMAWKQTYGNVGLSSLTRFADDNSLGWGLPRAPQSLMLTIGSVAWRPGIVDGRVEPRRFVAMALTVDHDLVDGGAGGRLLSDIVSRMTRCEGLDEVATNPSDEP